MLNRFCQIKNLVLAIAAVCISLSACNGNDKAADAIAAAEQAVDVNDYALARSICDGFDTDSSSTLSASELCRLSLVYMKLSDADDADINTAAATQCYRSALRADSDSAMIFYNNVPIDEARHVEIMSQLNRILNGSRDIYVADDSIGYTNDGEIEP